MARTRTRVTIVDVARAAGVSAATVSRVMNGNSTVDREMARRVRVAIAETGYVPDRTGRALRRQVSDVWAAIVPDVQNPFFTALVAGIEDVAMSRGLSVMLCNTDEDLSREQHYLATAVSQRIGGVIIAVTSEKSTDLSPVVAADIPIVLVDRRAASVDADTVSLDNRPAGEMVADHIASVGAERIACLTGPARVTTTQDRYLGFEARLKELGLGTAPGLVRRADLQPKGGYDAMMALLDDREPPDAVFVTNGPMTAGAYRALHERKVAMPDDLALVGVDDDLWTRMVSPEVSVVSQPVTLMGRSAAGLLLQRLGGTDGPPVRIALAPTLTIRGSSRRA